MGITFLVTLGGIASPFQVPHKAFCAGRFSALAMVLRLGLSTECRFGTHSDCCFPGQANILQTGKVGLYLLAGHALMPKRSNEFQQDLTEILGQAPTYNWSYVAPRMMRNATAALFELKEKGLSEVAQTAEFSRAALQIARMWESFAMLGRLQAVSHERFIKRHGGGMFDRFRFTNRFRPPVNETLASKPAHSPAQLLFVPA